MLNLNKSAQFPNLIRNLILAFAVAVAAPVQSADIEFPQNRGPIPFPAKAIMLVDDFEDLDISNWNPGSGCTATVDFATAAQGSSSLRIDEGCAGGYLFGWWKDIGSFQATDVSLYIRSGNDTMLDAVFAIGDDNIATENPVILLSADQGGYWVFTGPTVAYALVQYDSLVWYHIQFSLDWTARTVDVRINGAPVGDDLPFRSTIATTLTRVHLANQGPSTTSWWDYIVLSSAPPAPGLIFVDGFELGNMSAWSQVVGGP